MLCRICCRIFSLFSKCNLLDLVNLIHRYDSTTGTFSVPSGGDGFYYFSTYLTGEDAEYSSFSIQVNGDTLCTVRLEQQQTSGDALQSSCSAATYAAQGILVVFITSQNKQIITSNHR